MQKMAIIGHDRDALVDCSDVIPVPKPLPASAGPHLLPDTTHGDIEQACATAPFPALTALPGEWKVPLQN
ncbi:hypothetical protein HHX47_DHR3000383 [Lentinula edodes]|nr:hypothetical protein HHX47_DHR3000383 [Lentinula edodes]